MCKSHDDKPNNATEENQAGVTRRNLLKQGTAAALTGVAAAASSRLAAQQSSATSSAGQTSSVPPVGETFKAFVRQPAGAEIQDVRLLPIQENMVVVRSEAAQCCYSIINQALGENGEGSRGDEARILGHGGVGIVEAVGPSVRRVRPGDRVLVTNTPNCGECYNCLRGRGDICQMNPSAGEPLVSIGELADGTPVVQHNNTGGFGELMVTYEWYCVPAFTDAAAEDLAMLGCVGACGLGAVTTYVPADFGSNVVVFGAGPVGLSAIQGARIMGAAQIIAIEPIAARRELALSMGATLALDPNVVADNLVQHIRDLCSGPTDRKLIGGRDSRPNGDSRGADLVVATVGAEFRTPTVERGPDPTALLPTKQAWECTRAAGRLVTLGLPRGEISLPAGTWSNRGRIHYAGQYGGVNAKADVPRFVELINQGLFDAGAMVTMSVPMGQTKQAFQAVADRTTVGAVVTFN
jgi:S-(hydroxymethyl)glutathione dehydrogenase/alcohol dehydrogenase